MTITTTFNKDLMTLRDVKNMAETLESLIDTARSVSGNYNHEFEYDLTAEEINDFFWRFVNATKNIRTWKEEEKK